VKKALLLQTLGEAKSELAAAESDLERALTEILVAPRAEKVTVSSVVEAAFQKLRAARKRLAEAETLVVAEPDEPA